ncbi:MAG: phage tail protein [Anaerolineae bacterium]
MPDRGKDHLLLNARAGWRAAILDRTVLADEEAHLRLRPLPGAARPLVDAKGSFGGLALPTGLAVDAEERVYILDSQAHVIKRFDPCTETFEVLPCIGGPGSEPRQLRDPRGLATSCRGDLYVADTGNRRVQVFALKGLPLRGIWGPLKVIREGSKVRVEPTACWEPAPGSRLERQPESDLSDRIWQPWDVALSRDNWAYVSDYANGLIHIFDPWGCWRSSYTGKAPDVPPLERPTHIALDKAGRLYVVQDGKDYVTVLDADGNFLQRVERPEQIKGRFCPIAVAVDEEGNLYISERLTRRVYLYCPATDGCYTYAGACRSFNGLGAALAFDRAGNPLLSDAEQRRVFRLETQATFETEGRYYSEPLDSHIYRCQWHRILMRAAIQPGTQIRIDTLTSESPKTAAEIQSLPEARWATGQINPLVGDGDWDCLIQGPPGRYLWLRLTLVGDGTATPAVQRIKVYYPRVSSLQYLPAVYSEDAVSRDFMGRFLSIFDTIWSGIADQITDIARYFDPAATPANGAGPGDVDFLSWLASWLSLTLDRHWPEEKRRHLLQRAHRLYTLRGTPEGLRLHIQLYTDVEPRILEHFKLRRWLFLDHAQVGDQSALWGTGIVGRLQLDEQVQINSFQLIDSGDPLRDPFHHHAHQFTVFVPLRGRGSDVQKQTLERIVEMAKPAHTQGYVQLVEPRFRVGVQAFIGLDTVIGQYPDQVIAGEGQLGYDTVLGPALDESGPSTMRVGVRARIGSSRLMD